MSATLEGHGITAGYETGNDILQDVNIVVERGQMVAVVGPNGAGKSSLLRAVVGLLPIRSGTIRLSGTDITRTQPYAIIAQRVGYVPQLKNVFKSLTVEENLRIGLHSRRHLSPDARMHVVFSMFSELEDRRRQLAGNLSGGQRQMLAVARALMPDPVLLLLDEPMTGLAPGLADGLFHRLREISRSGTSILLVEQKAARALSFADKGYCLDQGRVMAEGPSQQLANDPFIAEKYLGTACVGKNL